MTAAARPTDLQADRQERIRQLQRNRPRSPFVRYSLLAFGLLLGFSWWRPELWPRDFLSPRRLANLDRFLGELRPYPLQGREFDGGVAFAWAMDILQSKGWAAAGTTLAMSIAAIVLAALVASVMGLTAARSLACAEPYLPSPRRPSVWQRLRWRSLVAVSRLLLMLARALPEYVWAFLLLAILGPSPWPIVLALALHNLGILGKLGSEVVDDVDGAPLRALRGLGASRSQIAVAGLFPLLLPRWLLFFFYRWETCVREATVLGMLGVASLGYWIVDARARTHYDVMFFFVLMGAAIILLGDLVSALARNFVRKAT